MEGQPLISVIMSAYNEEKYIEAALNSILEQTVQNFEIIIFDDCSTDHTVQIIESIQDQRIHIQRNTENCGLTKNLNKGLKLARGRYIARMDGDDISLPERFESQIHYFETHPQVMLISCQTQTFGTENLTWKLEDNPDKLKIMMLVRPVLAHPGYMMRRELLEEGYIYDETFRSAQDYDLAARVTRKYSIGIAKPILLQYRAHEEQVSNKSGKKQFENADRVRRFLMAELDMELTEIEIAQYHKFVLEEKTGQLSDFMAVNKILHKIMQSNEKTKIYDKELLQETMQELFYTWIIRNKELKIFVHIFHICEGRLGNLSVFFKVFWRILKKNYRRNRIWNSHSQ